MRADRNIVGLPQTTSVCAAAATELGAFTISRPESSILSQTVNRAFGQGPWRAPGVPIRQTAAGPWRFALTPDGGPWSVRATGEGRPAYLTYATLVFALSCKVRSV